MSWPLAISILAAVLGTLALPPVFDQMVAPVLDRLFPRKP